MLTASHENPAVREAEARNVIEVEAKNESCIPKTAEGDVQKRARKEKKERHDGTGAREKMQEHRARFSCLASSFC